ncbi:cadherin-like beta sandwich domain-containing protein [Ochrobactrum sp. SFR4]|uniref:cadherin-like beta sandwich domain-containing protein n=1 Tax=Ochrobactrum sp. SFR4 TaxID=2717368 RepID=UPI001C8B9AE4|nr:cadherin-like beta sandwich domain-containing protein [Ochrobactrum sp. SFR4]MBX8827196.1 autotransporter domain-containing protein [Ochrobactrum sp. SFR4]
MGALSAFGILRWRQYVIAVLGVIGLLLSSIGAQSAPVTSEQYFSGSNNTSISSRLTAVGDKIKFELVSAPSHGMIVLNANGAFTYTPVAGFTGDDSFRYQVEETGPPYEYSVNTAYITIFYPVPKVLSVNVPANGYYKAGSKLVFSVNFDQPVFVTGTPLLSITVGSDIKSAEYASGSDTNVLTFSYTVQSGDMDGDGITIGSITANGGSIRSSANEPAALTLYNVGATSGVLVNTASPTVTLSSYSSPYDTLKVVTVKFSEAVTGFAAKDINISLSGSVLGSASAPTTSDNINYTFMILSAGVGNIAVRVPAGSVVNLAGNSNLGSNELNLQLVASQNANLHDLIPSAGTLAPGFAPNTTSYTLNVAHDVENITLRPFLGDVNATVVVNGVPTSSGAASGAIPLMVGSNMVTTTVTAQDRASTKAYTVNVIRAQSDNADLVGLVPSAGSLDPAFSPSEMDYTITVPTETSSLQLTPASADPAATITINGGTVASGNASSALQLGIGDTTLTVVVTAQNGTTRSYRVNVTRAASADATLTSLIPSVGSLDPVFDKETLNYSLNVENSVENISFVPMVSEPAARVRVAGSTVASGSSSAPMGLGIGANMVSIVVTAPNGNNRNYTVVVSRAALVFPDPTLDPEVIGLLNAQTSTARRFAQVQIRNFQNRLEQLHNEGDRRKSSLAVRLGGQSPAQQTANQSDPDSSGSEISNAVLGYAPEKRNNFPGKAIGLKAPEQPAPALDPDLGPFALWSSGFVNFGERDSGKIDLDYTLVGVSGGIDYRFSEKLVAGFGAGYGRDRTDIGNNGTESRANAYSAAVYGSYKPIENFFIDALVGGSILDFESTRFITPDGDLTDGKRDGRQLFGSLTAAYEFRRETWLVSPYSRLEMSRSWLDGYAEGGESIYRLTYGNQTVDTVTGVVGLRANYAIDYTWGRLTPGVRVEYAHDFQGASRAAMGYSALGGLPYVLDIKGEGSDSGNIGLSLDFSFENAWTTGIEYQTGFGGFGARDHAFALRIGAKF